MQGANNEKERNSNDNRRETILQRRNSKCKLEGYLQKPKHGALFRENTPSKAPR